MNGTPQTVLTLRTSPRYGRRAVLSLLVALGLFGLSFAIDEAAANQIGYSEMPTVWARYLSVVALYYAVICAFRLLRRRRVKTHDNQRRP